MKFDDGFDEDEIKKTLEASKEKDKITKAQEVG
jgi:hypothetical protein